VVQVQGGYGACFCRRVTRFDRSWACRGTMLIGARKLSRYRIINEGTGAVSRYRFDRSQKTVKVYRIYIACNGARPGATTITKLFWEQGFAKTVTNNLPILSVLGAGVLLFVPLYKMC
jgi:hypothetical protein